MTSDKLKDQFNEFLNEMRHEVEMVNDKANEFKDNGITKAESVKSN